MEAHAHWLTAEILACPWDLMPWDWPGGATGAHYELWFTPGDLLEDPVPGERIDPFRGLEPASPGVYQLEVIPEGLPEPVAAQFPHLRERLALRLAGPTRGEIATVLQGAVGLVARSADLSVRTGVQAAGVLDDLFGRAAARRELGPAWADGVPSLALWAPTAREVTLLLLESSPDGEPTRVPMQRSADGTWTVVGERGWAGLGYRYEVTVFVPEVGAVVRNVVTDPYAVSLLADSRAGALVDLGDPATRPPLWGDTPVPASPRPVDRTIYELHVRDFSAADPAVPPAHRGKFVAFADDGAGAAHLSALAAAGLNTVHLLPVFDFASVPEDAARLREVTEDLAAHPPDSAAQQAAVGAIRHHDAYNWGYEPWHWLAPEGSYAVDPDGAGRVAEMRTMIGALHRMGLQVVLDQVYNHTTAHGQDPRSLLDRIVPGYYHRFDERGAVYASTCCSNVATERVMAQKLMVDAVVHWARHYKVGGFRFDLMGHHSRANLLAVRAALDALTPAADGVDGRGIYLYGEGWNFGEVAGDRLFPQARQGALGRTGIGTFSDRLRDAVHGGSAVSHHTLLVQGFGTGLATAPNGTDPRPVEHQYAELGHLTDLVRLGMAGNLRDFVLEVADGRHLRGEELGYAGQAAGYADEPDEVVTYVDAHDNHTLFDLLTLKLSHQTSMSDRVRMNQLCLATTALAQTPVLWHAGTDLLRSKSLDADSYDSGDWFNLLDFTGRENGFGRGLPPVWRNEALWPIYAPLLVRADLKPDPEHIALAREWSRDLLRMRFSTPLLRLGSARAILAKVRSPRAAPGVVVLHVDDRAGADADPALDGALVVVNATPWVAREHLPGLAGRVYRLSPVQEAGVDDVVRRTTWDSALGMVTVPPRTAALLVEPAGAV